MHSRYPLSRRMELPSVAEAQNQSEQLLEEHNTQLEDIVESLVGFSTEDEGEKSEASRYLPAYNDILPWEVRQGTSLAALGIDRRCLRAYAEGWREAAVCSLVCMVCARNFPHVEGRRGNPIAWQKVSPNSDSIFELPGSIVRQQFSVNSYVGRYATSLSR